MEPVWQLLNTKAKNDSWNEKHKAGLRSAAAGRQFPQARVKMCGWANHDRCLTCLSRIVESENPYIGSKKRTARDAVTATEEQLEKAPLETWFTESGMGGAWSHYVGSSRARKILQ